MKFVILFEDNPDASPDIRSTHMPDHLAFLERNKNSVDAAGPLKDEAGQPAGGIWIVDADSADTARKLIEEDPFWPTGLRKSVSILAWTQVFADGQRRVSL